MNKQQLTSKIWEAETKMRSKVVCIDINDIEDLIDLDEAQGGE